MNEPVEFVFHNVYFAIEEKNSLNKMTSWADRTTWAGPLIPISIYSFVSHSYWSRGSPAGRIGVHDCPYPWGGKRSSKQLIMFYL